MDKNNDDWFEKEQLHFAVQDGDLEKIRILMASGSDLNAFDEIGKTPLHYAVKEEHLEIAKFLLQHGASVNAHHEPTISNTPLGEVAGNCSLQMARLLIEAGADPTIPGWMQLTALDRASKRKRGEGPEVYALLLKAAGRGHKRSLGHTPKPELNK